MEKNPLGNDGDDRLATSHQFDLSFAICNHGYRILIILAILIVSLISNRISGTEFSDQLKIFNFSIKLF